MKKGLITLALFMVALTIEAQTVSISTAKKASNRELYAAQYLQKKLADMGYNVTKKKGDVKITLSNTATGPAEGYAIACDKKGIKVTGNDGTGVIYGCVELADRVKKAGNFNIQPTAEQPEMLMRGTCIGIQKTVFLPGHAVYEYPYTPENFPWFYDKQEWVKYLDMMVENKMNSLYLWNGHPFASLVKLKDYPFALEVDEETFKKNEEVFSFLTSEADKRGIFVIQMFYNILLSKPFADHYGLKTQDRNRPITPLVSDYTRKSIAAFVEKYPNIGFLVCLGEAMATIEDDITWMKETIIPGIKDGLAARGRTDIPPVVLRSHDTDGPRVLRESLPLYPNIYTMSKYNGESLTTYQPRGPWSETHRQLAAAAPIHIENVHILANLEPWRWASPLFTQKTVKAMHEVHHANGLHLYPQANYWDYPYTADRLPNGGRLKQIDRDWMWYKAWGRYAWKQDRGNDEYYWKQELADYYGFSTDDAALLLKAYDEAGEIAPKLLRRFGITEGNRQTLLLGMKMAQLVNPYKFNIYHGFYESCGPEGEKLIEYVEKEWKGEAHVGELPLDIVDQCLRHGETAVSAVEAITAVPTRHQDEFQRVKQDFTYYRLFAESFRYKIMAAQHVLNYKWTKDVKYLDLALPFMERSLACWHQLAEQTAETYLYANSMQTSHRRIPVGGNGGKMCTWTELETVYKEELEAFKENLYKLKHPAATDKNIVISPAQPAQVKLLSAHKTVPLQKGAILFERRQDTPVDSVAPELTGMQAIVLNRDTTRIKGTTIAFETERPVKLLVGFFNDDDNKWARPPKLEVDATGNEYGQAEPILTNALSLVQMPKINIHSYHMPAGRHTLRLPRGIILVAGFTASDIKPRDCGLNGGGNEVDWLFMK